MPQIRQTSGKRTKRVSDIRVIESKPKNRIGAPKKAVRVTMEQSTSFFGFFISKGFSFQIDAVVGVTFSIPYLHHPFNCCILQQGSSYHWIDTNLHGQTAAQAKQPALTAAGKGKRGHWYGM